MLLINHAILHILIFLGVRTQFWKGRWVLNLHFLFIHCTFLIFTFYWNSILKGMVSFSFNSRWARLDFFVKKINNMINIFKINFSDVHITFSCTIGCLDKLLIALKKLHPCSDLYIFQEINYFIGTIRALKYIKMEDT